MISFFKNKSNRKAVFVFGGYGIGIIIALYFAFLPNNQNTLISFFTFVAAIFFGLMMFLHYKPAHEKEYYHIDSLKKETKTETEKRKKSRNEEIVLKFLKENEIEFDLDSLKATPDKILPLGKVQKTEEGDILIKQDVSIKYSSKNNRYKIYKTDTLTRTHSLLRFEEI